MDVPIDHLIRLKCKWTRKGKDETPHSVFPFTFNGNTYDGCTRDGTAPYAPYLWCASNITSEGNIVKTGICDPDCPGVGKKSFF